MKGEEGGHAHDVLSLCLADPFLRTGRMPLAVNFKKGIHNAPSFPKTCSCCSQEEGPIRQRAGVCEKRCNVFGNL